MGLTEVKFLWVKLHTLVGKVFSQENNIHYIKMLSSVKVTIVSHATLLMFEMS